MVHKNSIKWIRYIDLESFRSYDEYFIKIWSNETLSLLIKLRFNPFKFNIDYSINMGYGLAAYCRGENTFSFYNLFKRQDTKYKSLRVKLLV